MIVAELAVTLRAALCRRPIYPKTLYIGNPEIGSITGNR